MDDLDRSFERLNRAEKYRAKAIGYGMTLQGRTLAKKYRQQLAASIGADRARNKNNKTLWRALKGIDNETLALRLLVAGISVCGSDNLGTDRDGEKNFRAIALWIGSNLDHRGELGWKVGVWGIEMLLALPVFTLEGRILVLTADVNDFMDDVFVHAIINHPLLSPLTTPPEPWTQVRKGGLPADHWARVGLIRPHHPLIERDAHEAISTGQMQKALDAINALQAVAYTINEPVLDFILRNAPPSPGPKPPIWQESNFKRWTKMRAELRGFHTDMVIAEAMAGSKRFYVPLNIDFRGRLYGVSDFNFTREDRVRGLFLFADGKPIGEEGLRWLMIHVAALADGNTWSKVQKPSKLHLRDRLSWTHDNLETVRTIGEAVLRRDDPAALPALPEDKYQFLAACVELVQALDAGPDFPARLPLTFDASCSGLQHLCLMTRADDEGRYANLVPSREARDFYSEVAAETYDRADPEIRQLMTGPDDRKIVKRPVMSYFYGVGPGNIRKLRNGRWQLDGMTKQVVDVLKERGQLTKGAWKLAQKLAQTIYGIVEERAPKATAVRDFLEKLVRLCADNNEPLRWTTPLGLPVINRYHKPEIETFSKLLNGRRHRANLAVGDKDEIDVAKAVRAVTANFTHSFDASHLQLVALAAAKEGIPMVSVHDCFGTIAPCAQRLNEIIRQELIGLHKRDLLNEVRESAKRDLPRGVELPTLPEKGNLNLEGVLFNVHAFK